MPDLINKLGSRKLIVFIVATVGYFLGFVTEDAWETVSLAYLGSQGLVDMVERGVKWSHDKAAKAASGALAKEIPAKLEPVNEPEGA